MSTRKNAFAILIVLVCMSLTSVGKENPIYQEKDGVVVMQFESAPAVDEWVLETSFKGYSGSGYYTWRGDDHFPEPSRGMLTFRFVIQNPGTYHLRFHSLHMHDDTSLENDVWTRMDGGEWKKTFATPNKEWTWMTKHDFGGYKPWASYVLGKGIHVLEFAGRSKNFSIDMIHLYKDGVFRIEDHTLPESSTVTKGNLAPRPDAGPEKNLTLPRENVVLSGTAEDIDGTVVAYEWEKVSGPSVQMKGVNSPQFKLSGLKPGEYVFRLKVTDNERGTGYDDIKVIVYPASQVSVADSVFVLSGGQVEFEAEAVSARGQWKLEKENDGYSGADYLVWRGRNYFDDPQVGPQFAYKIRIEEDGEYSFRIRDRHDHRLGDQENDTWVRFDDGRWVKCYSNEKQKWTWQTGFIDFDGFWPLTTGVHTLYLSPRSFGHKLDRIHVFKKGAVQKSGVRIDD